MRRLILQPNGRISHLVNIPDEWVKNKSLGRCPPCGKRRSEFQRGRRTYCSSECHLIYIRCYKSWGQIRDEIIKRDGHKCVICGNGDNLEVDHIKAIANGGDPVEPSNLRTLCRRCHGVKSGEDRKQLNLRRKGQKTLLEEGRQ